MKGSTQSRSFRTFFFCSLLIPVFLATQVPATQESACGWQRGDLHKMHWPQLPDLSAAGTDVSLSDAVLADDFRCSATGPVRDIHIWASFLDDTPPKEGPNSLTLELRIYSDVPADGKTWSRPGELLWQQTFSPDQYTVSVIHDGPENWYDPVMNSFLANNHRRAYQCDFCAAEPFVQQEGNVYWLAVSLPDPNVSGGFGWKTTSRQWQWNDRAAYLPPDSSDWLAMDYPQGHGYAGQPLDLAFVITSGDNTTAAHDLGDAPDSSNSFPTTQMPAYPDGTVAYFPTIQQAGSPPYGPLHLTPRDAVYLGRWVSLENEADLGPDEDTVNNLSPSAGVSNRDGADDGLQFPVVMPSCQETTLDYAVTVTSDIARQVYVNIWCDWNRDGDWNDTIECDDGTIVPEWVVQDHQPAPPGLGTFTLTSPAFLCWHPETATDPSPLWVRITISEQPWAGDPSSAGSGPEEGYQYGETEDYYLKPQAEPAAAAYDWGDALDDAEMARYPTLMMHDGARHVIGGPWLGSGRDQPDAEPDGQPDLDALGDNGHGNDDENGVSIPPLVQGQGASLTLQVNGGGGVVQGWIDFNADYIWQPSEQVVNGFLPDGVHVMSFSVPRNAATGMTYARFRISTRGGLDPNGPASDGEAEDHEVWIRPLAQDVKWYQGPDLTPRGIDIRADGNDLEPRVLADDFQCTSQDLLTLIRLWGSWKDDQQGRIEKIRVSIHPDDPAGPVGPDQENQFSKPAPEVLWETDFQAGQFEETLYHATLIGGAWWWDPASGELIPSSDTKVWQIDLKVDPNQAFLQSGSLNHPEIFWLAVQVETADGQFGWKTRRWPEHFMDDAALDVGSKLPRPWQELRYPEGHPAYDLAMNSIDLAFSLMYTTVESEQPTSRPTSLTQCPAVETICPATSTHCPAMTTLCPAVETKCPVVATQCPAFQTQCPSSQTACPVTMTQCPTVETRCPATETQCPTMTTSCPAVATKCPAKVTACPTAPTQCPASQTVCPAVLTQCPATQTECPQTLTQCPTVQTGCPPVATFCPMVATQCPTMQTQCPVTETECPSVPTQCPVDSAKCSSDSKLSSAQNLTSVLSWTSCPVADVACPTIAEYLGAVGTE